MKKKFYLTTSIAYANAAPHMGFAYEAILADIIARYKKQVGEQVFFLSGTDEHGDKIVRAARAQNLTPQAFVDSNAAQFKQLFVDLGIEPSFFIRTSDKEHHWPGAQALWVKLLKSGDIYKGVYKGLYCVGCEAFITEKDLIGGKCPHHDVPPEKIEEENYFFRLSKYSQQIKEKIENNELEIIPTSRKNEILALFDEGLQDISFSRPEGEIPWGVPVPNDKGQMMYVWCDALSNYISALGYGREDNENFKTFWPADVHIIGKDIVRFHTAIWPGMLLSAGLPLPKKIFVHGFITSGGKKMSKSLGNVINPQEFIERFGADALRYYIAREISPTEDGDFTEEKFIETYNANLANGLGNLLSRTIKMATQYFDGNIAGENANLPPIKKKIETMQGESSIEDFSIPYVFEHSILPEYHKQMGAFEIHKAADVVWEAIGILDGYIADYEPFKLIKNDPEGTKKVLWGVLYGLCHIADMLHPMMPKTAMYIHSHIQKEFSDKNEVRGFVVESLPEPLFKRIA